MIAFFPLTWIVHVMPKSTKQSGLSVRDKKQGGTLSQGQVQPSRQNFMPVQFWTNFPIM
jgi:hypothetical protein